MLTKDGTEGRVYGGDPNLIHIADGSRATFANGLVRTLDEDMRYYAIANGQRTSDQGATQALCPGCYMVVLFNMAVLLAERNGQSLSELGLTMANAFAMLADNPTAQTVEEIAVILDPDECPLPAVEMRD